MLEYSRSLHHDGDTHGMNGFLHCNGNLSRQTLLHLESPTERLGNARQLREAKHKAFGDVSYRYLSLKFDALEVRTSCQSSRLWRLPRGFKIGELT